jgi:hypothetical protein
MQPGTNGVRRLRLAGSRGARAAVLGVAGAAAAAAIVGLAVPAGASTLTPQHHAEWGTEHFQLVSDSTSQTSTSNPVIAYGVFTDQGTDYQKSNNTDTFVFPGGKIYVSHTPAPGSGNPTFNAKTCMFSFAETGTFTLTGGTGKYRHIAGHGTYALSVIGISTRLANGQCNPSDTAPLAAQQEILQAVGQVRLH